MMSCNLPQREVVHAKVTWREGELRAGTLIWAKREANGSLSQKKSVKNEVGAETKGFVFVEFKLVDSSDKLAKSVREFVKLIEIYSYSYKSRSLQVEKLRI